LRQALQIAVSGFLVTGASKRGWTTWLTAVVDKRVKAIAPMVYDNLNLLPQMQHQMATWGQFSEQISEYTDRSLPQLLLSKAQGADKLAALIDPFAYRSQITVPKLIINATNDRYWPLDALNIYYPDLSGATYLLYVPNAGHEFGAEKTRALQELVAFFGNITSRVPFPKLLWDFQETIDSITFTITSDLTPRMVRVWIATAPTKDFREATWQSFAMKQVSHRYTYTYPRPIGAYAAIFGEAEYFEKEKPLFLSTQIRIFP
jgi:PhoPQ-activated pathogenicity-related protein